MFGVEDRPKAQGKTRRRAPPCAFIIFGAGGDLTKRLLMPVIYNLAKTELLSERFAIIASIARPNRSKRFVNIWRKGSEIIYRMTASGPANEPFDRRAWEFVESRIIHFTARNLPCGQRRPLGRRCPAVAQPPPMAAANVTAAPYSTLAR
jgi:hypothetical protein